MLKASIVGGSGYVGGELLRLLLDHPMIEVAQVTSQRLAGQFVYGTHPNLRSHTKLKFSALEELAACDVLFLALPHGKAATQIEHFAQLATYLIDCSADFRLRDPATYQDWYGEPHPNPAWLDKFVYGLPELKREELRTAKYVSVVGCNATVSNLALLPLAKACLIDKVVVDVKVGSS